MMMYLRTLQNKTRSLSCLTLKASHLFCCGLLCLLSAHVLATTEKNEEKAEVHDPTKPPSFKQRAALKAGNKPQAVKTKKKSSGFYVKMITIAPDERSAIVNGRTVTEGDSIKGAKIVKIDTEGVSIRKSNKTEKYYLFKKTKKLSITHNESP